MSFLRRCSLPGVEHVERERYARTVRFGEHVGYVRVADVPERGVVELTLSASLLPALMPLLARLRRLFDLDAQPAVVDAHLAAGGLGRQVERRPGLRVPGAFDGFEVALSSLLLGSAPTRGGGRAAARQVVRFPGEPIATGTPELDRLPPDARRILEADRRGLVRLGVPVPGAAEIVTVARAVGDRSLRLEPGADAAETHRVLVEECGVDRRLAMSIVMRVLHWPDVFPASDPALQRAMGSASASALHTRSAQWRPWRSYAALHLWGQE